MPRYQGKERMNHQRVTVELLRNHINLGRVGFQDGKKGGVFADWFANECKSRHSKCHFEYQIEDWHRIGAAGLVQMLIETAPGLFTQVWKEIV